MSLNKLDQIDSNHKWVVDHCEIKSVLKKKGQLKNIIDFDKVVKFTSQKLQDKNQISEVSIENLGLKYRNIKLAVQRQFCLTRFFLKIVLYFMDFDKHFEELHQQYKSLKVRHSNPLINQQPNQVEIKENDIQSPQPVLRGGFANGGDTCFGAAALQCLNAMWDVLPKNIERDLKKSEDESPELFERRKKVAKEVLRLLEKSNNKQTCLGEEISIFLSLLLEYRDHIDKKASDLRKCYALLLEVFKIPQLKYDYVRETGEKKTYETQYLTVDVEQTSTNWDRLKDFKEKEGYSLETKKELLDKETSSAPLFVPISIRKKIDQNVSIPKVIAFTNLPECKFHLVVGGAGGEGHAYAFVKSNEEWVLYNDAVVKKVSEEEVMSDLSKNSLLLLYRLNK